MRSGAQRIRAIESYCSQLAVWFFVLQYGPDTRLYTTIQKAGGETSSASASVAIAMRAQVSTMPIKLYYAYKVDVVARVAPPLRLSSTDDDDDDVYKSTIAIMSRIDEAAAASSHDAGVHAACARAERGDDIGANIKPLCPPLVPTLL